MDTPDLAAVTATFFGSVGTALGTVIVAALALMATVIGVKALVRWGKRAVNG